MSEISLRDVCLHSRNPGENSEAEFVIPKETLCHECRKAWGFLGNFIANSGSGLDPDWGSEEDVLSWGSAFTVVSLFETDQDVPLEELEQLLSYFDRIVLPGCEKESGCSEDIVYQSDRARVFLVQSITIARMSDKWIHATDTWALYLHSLFPERPEERLFASARGLALFFDGHEYTSADALALLSDVGEELEQQFSEYFGFSVKRLLP